MAHHMQIWNWPEEDGARTWGVMSTTLRFGATAESLPALFEIIEDFMGWPENAGITVGFIYTPQYSDAIEVATEWGNSPTSNPAVFWERRVAAA